MPAVQPRGARGLRALILLTRERGTAGPGACPRQAVLAFTLCEQVGKSAACPRCPVVR